jgi:hypothetical protein
LNVDFAAGKASGSLKGQGKGAEGYCDNASRPARTGQVQWSVSYTATDLSGSVGPNGLLQLAGTLKGQQKYSDWKSCTAGFQNVLCASIGFVDGSNSFSYTIQVHGELDQSTGQGTGVISFTKISLPTSGVWNVP